MGTALLTVWKRMAEAASEVATDRMILEDGVVVSGEYIIFLRRVLSNVRVLAEFWGFTSIYIYILGVLESSFTL